MNETNPDCEYVTVDEYRESIKQMNNTKYKYEWVNISKSISKHRIDNAFTKEGLPVSDQKHGMFKMFPPELLHTTYEGLTKYMLKVLSGDYLENADRLRGAVDPRGALDSLHHYNPTRSLPDRLCST